MFCENWASAATAYALRAVSVPAGSVLLPKLGAALLNNARRLTTRRSVFDNNVLAVVPNFQLRLTQLLISAVGETVASTLPLQLRTVDEADLCRVHVPPSDIPVEATVAADKGGQTTKRSAFYVRIGNGTREIVDDAERAKYVAGRFGLDGRAA